MLDVNKSLVEIVTKHNKPAAWPIGVAESSRIPGVGVGALFAGHIPDGIKGVRGIQQGLDCSRHQHQAGAVIGVAFQ